MTCSKCKMYWSGQSCPRCPNGGSMTLKTWLFPLMLLISACTSNGGGGGSSKGGGDGFYDYAGTYVTAVEGSLTDSEGADEEVSFTINMLIEQNGPAIILADILAVADAGGLSFGHTVKTIDFWSGSLWNVSYEGSSRSGDPLVIDLVIEGEYPDLAYDYKYVYVLTIGDEIPY